MGFHLPESKAKKSYGAVAVFALIALAGALLTLSSYPGGGKTIAGVEPETVNPKVSVSLPSVGIQYVTKTVLVTGLFVLFLLLGTKWYKKRWRNKVASAVDFTILGRRYLSSKHYLLLIRIKNRDLLLGVTDQNITLLANDESEGEEEEYSLPEQEDGMFTSALKSLLKKESV